MGNTLNKPEIGKETKYGSFGGGGRCDEGAGGGGGSGSGEGRRDDDDTMSCLEYGVSSMQGWRTTMEDAHLCEPTLYAEEKEEEEKVATSAAEDGSAEDGRDDDDNVVSSTKFEGTPLNTPPNTTTTTSSTTKYKSIPLPGHALFGVFDGHGGKYASKFAERNLGRIFRRQTALVQYANFLRRRREDERREEVQSKGGGGVLVERKGLSKASRRRKKNERTKKEKRKKKGKAGCADHQAVATAAKATMTLSAEEEGTYKRLLEISLHNAFLDLDREMLQEMLKSDVFRRSAGGSKVKKPPPPPETGGVAAKKEGDAPPPSGAGGGGGGGVGAGGGVEIPYDETDPGTTAAVLLFTPHFVVCANLGDCRTVLHRDASSAYSLSAAAAKCNSKSSSNKSSDRSSPESEGEGEKDGDRQGQGKEKEGEGNDDDDNSDDDSVVPLSTDHKPDIPHESARIYKAGGYVFGNRVDGELAVSRALGDFNFKEFNVVLDTSQNVTTAEEDNPDEELNLQDDDDSSSTPSPRDRRKDATMKVSSIPDVVFHRRDDSSDRFIVCACDGIWDVVTNRECMCMVDRIFDEGEDNLGLVCEEVLYLCLKKGSQDNMTAMVFKLPGQTIGKGGGIAKRRRKRSKDGDDDNHQTDKGGPSP